MKDSVKKNSESLQHFPQKSDQGADVYMENVLNSPLGKSFLWLREDKDGLTVKFRTVYHNIKKWKPIHRLSWPFKSAKIKWSNGHAAN